MVVASGIPFKFTSDGKKLGKCEGLRLDASTNDSVGENERFIDGTNVEIPVVGDVVNKDADGDSGNCSKVG